MQKTIILFLLACSVLFSSEQNCDIPDWLMEDMSNSHKKAYKKKCGKAINQINSSSDISKEKAMSKIEEDLNNFKSLSKKYKNNKDIIIFMILTYSHTHKIHNMIDYAITDPKLRKDKDFFLRLIEQLLLADSSMSGLLIESIIKKMDSSLLKEKKFMFKLIAFHSGAIKFAHKDIKNDKDIILSLIKNGEPIFDYDMDKSLRKDYDIAMAAVSQHSSAIAYVDKNTNNYFHIALASISKNIDYFSFLDERLKQDKKFLLAAIKENEEVMSEIKYPLSKDKNFILHAIKENGDAFKFVEYLFQKDEEIILTALETNSNALIYANDSLKKTQPLCTKST